MSALADDLVVAVLHRLPAGRKFTRKRLAATLRAASKAHPNLFGRFTPRGTIGRVLKVLVDDQWILPTGKNGLGMTLFKTNTGIRVGGQVEYEHYNLEERRLIDQVAEQITAESA